MKLIEYPEGYEDMVVLPGLEEAVIGYSSCGRCVYDADKIIQILQDRDGMEEGEAREYYSFNIECAYFGELTPIYITINHVEFTDG